MSDHRPTQCSSKHLTFNIRNTPGGDQQQSNHSNIPLSDVRVEFI